MDTKKFIIGTLAGGVAYFILGFLVYAFLLESFYAGHTVSGIMKTDEQMKYYPLALGNLAHGALLSYVFLKWANIKSFAAGLTGGAVIGFFMAAGFNLVTYDTAMIMSAVGTVADVFVYTAISALAGGIVGAVLGMGGNS